MADKEFALRAEIGGVVLMWRTTPALSTYSNKHLWHDVAKFDPTSGDLAKLVEKLLTEHYEGLAGG